MTKKISFLIEYAGLQLQVVKNEQGEDVVPLKPLCDLFGLQWERQRKKVMDDPEIRAALGASLVGMYGAGNQKRDQVCILLARVTLFLLGLSPARIKANGNEDGAAFLKAKQLEWADALHDYELLGVAFNLNHQRADEARRKEERHFAFLIARKAAAPDADDRKAFDKMARASAARCGASYQPELDGVA